MNFGDSVLTLLVYVAGGLLIVAIPICLIIFLIKNPLDFIFKSWADAKYRITDNAMRTAERITVDDGTIIVKQLIDGKIDYKKVHEPRHVTVTTNGAQYEPDVDAMGAARWIVASYATRECNNPKHKHGPNGTQLLTQDECLDPMFSVFGSPREWQDARNWLVSNRLVVEQISQTLPGTCADRPLSEMIKILTTLPVRKP